jgi:putative inorganic carbon (hco3(-)) transporter
VTSRSAAAGRVELRQSGTPLLPAFGGSAMLAAAIAALVLLGYAAIADVRIAVACLGAGVLAAWGLAAFHQPRLAMVVSLSLLLVAGTKFRTRDADASLAGALDAQVALELALFAIVGVAVVSLWLTRSRERRLTGTELAVLAYGGLAAASIAWSEAPALTAVRASQLLVVGALAILTVRAVGPASALWMTSRAAAVHVGVCALVALCSPWADGAFSSEDSLDGGFRFRWFAVHPIDAATLAGLGAVGLLGALMFRRPSPAAPRRLRTVLWMTALVFVLVLTRSRGPMLALVAATGVLWLMRVRPTLRVAALLAAGAITASSIVFASELRSMVEWLASQDSAIAGAFFRGQSADTVFELNGRLGLWEELRPLVLDHLAVGYGYQASRSVLLAVADWAAYAHNAFLQTALDLGLLGIAIVLCLFAPIVRTAFARSGDRASRAPIAALAVFLALNAMSTEGFAAVPRFETLLLFVCALSATATTHATRALQRQAVLP